MLNGLYAENAYLVTDECAPYTGTSSDTCGRFEKCPAHSKATSSYFVGRGYGDASEKKMMKELIRNGLINTGLKSNLNLYKDGIVSESGLTSSFAQLEIPDGSLSDKNLEDQGWSW